MWMLFGIYLFRFMFKWESERVCVYWWACRSIRSIHVGPVLVRFFAHLLFLPFFGTPLPPSTTTDNGRVKKIKRNKLIWCVCLCIFILYFWCCYCCCCYYISNQYNFSECVAIRLIECWISNILCDTYGYICSSIIFICAHAKIVTFDWNNLFEYICCGRSGKKWGRRMKKNLLFHPTANFSKSQK